MTEERSVDTDHQADEAWILGVQRKLYQWSKAHPNDVWRDLWGWLTDPRTLRCAWGADICGWPLRCKGKIGLSC